MNLIKRQCDCVHIVDALLKEKETSILSSQQIHRWRIEVCDLA